MTYAIYQRLFKRRLCKEYVGRKVSSTPGGSLTPKFCLFTYYLLLLQDRVVRDPVNANPARIKSLLKYQFVLYKNVLTSYVCAVWHYPSSKLTDKQYIQKTKPKNSNEIKILTICYALVFYEIWMNTFHTAVQLQLWFLLQANEAIHRPADTCSKWRLGPGLVFHNAILS